MNEQKNILIICHDGFMIINYCFLCIGSRWQKWEHVFFTKFHNNENNIRLYDNL